MPDEIVFAPADYLSRIRLAYPNLRADSVRPIVQAGQNNDVLIVNEAIVFRFPRTASGVQSLPRQLAILRTLQGRTMLSVPHALYRSREFRSVGEAFTGYPRLPGEPFTSVSLTEAGAETALPDLAEQLGHFLRELHSVPVERIDLALAPLYGPAYWQRMYQEIQDHLYPSMSPDVRTQVSAHFERFLGDPEAFAYRPVLIHGDFGAGNILWNPEAREITGVIDFDSAGLSDPAIDLAAVSCFGEPLRAALLGVYPALEAAERRAAFYRGTFALQEALHGFHTGDRTAFERGMTPFCGGGNPTTPIT